MANQSFTLQPLLDHRQRLTRDQLVVVASQESALLAEQERLQDLELSLQPPPCSEESETVDIGDLWLHSLHRNRLEREIGQQERKVQEVRADLVEARDELGTKLTGLKVVERLKEKVLLRIQDQVKKGERRSLDEFAIRQAAMAVSS